MIFRIIFALALLIAQTTVLAGPLFVWSNVGNEPSNLPTDFYLRIQFTDATMDTGDRVSFNARNCDMCVYSDSPIEFIEMGQGGSGRRVWFRPSTVPMRYSDALNINLTLSAGGYLNGSIFGGNFQSDFSLSSADNVFRISGANSDAPGSGGCNSNLSGTCFGATGVIRDADVPEPASLALLVLGLCLIGGRARRR